MLSHLEVPDSLCTFALNVKNSEKNRSGGVCSVDEYRVVLQQRISEEGEIATTIKQYNLYHCNCL